MKKAVHPRVRGEGFPHRGDPSHAHGSSPRARGRLQRRAKRGHAYWFIPACAGKAALSSVRTRTATVHPRVRGEGDEGLELPSLQGGSSPRARGRRVHPTHPHHPTRFIPACAGKANSRRSDIYVGAVHPRVRGEGRRLIRASTASSGSSPRARGRLIAGQRVRATRRFIPACAGKASMKSLFTVVEAVHPRVRGEGRRAVCRRWPADGSSPRARGRLLDGFANNGQARFIPACAGKAPGRTWRRWRSPVHPRVRGEGCGEPGMTGSETGSSPRARGRR